MPKRTDIRRILLIGSGPTVIGQASEFDYAGSLACKALREEGFEVVLVNSNPAAVETDSGVADRTYIEPLTLESLKKIIERERPDALLPTFGGLLAWNMGMFLDREGALKQHGVRLIGVDERVIATSEDRIIFKQAMQSIGVPVPKSGLATSFSEGKQIIKEIGFPAILRPAYSMFGTEGGTIYNLDEYERMLAYALETSPVHQTLVEGSATGWKQIKFEVLRDSVDNVMVVSSLENLDPMGVNSGDSIVVSPAQTLAPDLLDSLTELAKKVIRAVNITGGIASVQFGVNPNGDDVVITEINPRITRNSALVARATGFPIARAAAKLAVGFTLDELKDEFPATDTIDYLALKISRFDFDKFPGADETLNTSTKSVGEAMAVGRSFIEALQEGIRSLEIDRFGLGSDGYDLQDKERTNPDTIRTKLAQPNAGRIFFIRYAIESGMSTSDISRLSKIDPWFIDSIREMVEFESKLAGKSLVGISADVLRQAKVLGYSDIQLAYLLETTEEQVRQRRKTLGIVKSYHPIFGGAYFATYEVCDESRISPSDRKVIVIGSGPNRIGQGTEFDYCTAHSLSALKEEGCESILINCNPGSAAAMPGYADKLYISALIFEDVLGIINRENPMGVITQMGGETSVKLGAALAKAGVTILGTSPGSINKARDRKALNDIISRLGLLRPNNSQAQSVSEALEKSAKIGYPVLVTFGEGEKEKCEIIYDSEDLAEITAGIFESNPGQILTIEAFLEDAVGVDVDAVSDGNTAIVCGVMEHIEQAGVHSGDSACSLPPHSLSKDIVSEIKRQARIIALELGVQGLINVEFAIKGDQAYILNANPSASRTAPFVCKATGTDWISIATKISTGKSLAQQGVTCEIEPGNIAVKEAVFPFDRFQGADVVLGPEMKSIGEVMGMDTSFGHAYIKAQIAAGQNLQHSGTVFLSVAQKHKEYIIEIARTLVELGYNVVATGGTAETLRNAGIQAGGISKIGEGRPDAIDLIKNKDVALIINTPSGKRPRKHEITIRSAIVASGVPIVTTIAGAKATLHGLKVVREFGTTVKSLQEYGLA